MTISEIKLEKEKRFDQLIKSVGMFFAFSTSQFHENKTPLKEGEKYVSIGMGGYMPKGNVEAYIKGNKEIDKWYKETIKANKARKANIAYELANHEAYYTGDVEQTLEALGEDYTREEVAKVYNEEKAKQD